MVRMFLLKNDKESKLGTTPLPDGVVRVYRDNGKDGLGFRVQQGIKYVPIGDDIELNLGPDPEVIHEWVKLKTWRDSFWFKRKNLEIYRDLEGEHKIEINDEVAGGRTTPGTWSGFATSEPSRSRWKSAARSAATSCSPAGSTRRCTTIRRSR